MGAAKGGAFSEPQVELYVRFTCPHTWLRRGWEMGQQVEAKCIWQQERGVGRDSHSEIRDLRHP